MPRIEIFSASDCRHCEAAKALLEARGLAFEERDVQEDPASLDELRRRLPRVKAIPQIFIDGDHVGGCEDLGNYLARNDLSAS